MIDFFLSCPATAVTKSRGVRTLSLETSFAKFADPSPLAPALEAATQEPDSHLHFLPKALGIAMVSFSRPCAYGAGVELLSAVLVRCSPDQTPQAISVTMKP